MKRIYNKPYIEKIELLPEERIAAVGSGLSLDLNSPVGQTTVPLLLKFLGLG